jgi:hypothetical protein
VIENMPPDPTVPSVPCASGLDTHGGDVTSTLMEETLYHTGDKPSLTIRRNTPLSRRMDIHPPFAEQWSSILGMLTYIYVKQKHCFLSIHPHIQPSQASWCIRIKDANQMESEFSIKEMVNVCSYQSYICYSISS